MSRKRGRCFFFNWVSTISSFIVCRFANRFYLLFVYYFCYDRTDGTWNEQGTIPFPYVLTDTTEAWNKHTNEFIVPWSGTYFFTINTAARSSQISVHIQINQRNYVSSTIIICCSGQNGSETINRSTMTLLHVGDAVRVAFSGGLIFSDIRYRTSFLGFLYKLLENVPKIAWSVYTDRNIYSLVDPVQFNCIFVNEGSGWYTSHRLLVPVKRIYYANIIAQNNPNYNLNVALFLNDQPTVLLIRASSGHGQLSQGRSIKSRSVNNYKFTKEWWVEGCINRW